MKPIRLKMAGFGPFPDVVEVDFERLAGRGLFLIAGETGSGKSTILDGIFGALFADTAGDERNLLTDMPTHHRRNGAAQTSSLELDFRVGDRMYRVARSWRDEKNRQHQATFWEIRADGTIIDGTDLSGVVEVKDRVRSVLGLGPDEFRRVCLLPQEQIRAAITAPGKERREMLGRLFDATRFEQIERKAKELAKSAEERFKEAQREVSQVRQLLGIQASDDLEQLLSDAKSNLRDADATLKLAKETHAALREAERDHARRQREFEGHARSCKLLRMTERHLETRVPGIEHRLRQAREVQPLIASLDRLAKLEADARTSLTDAAGHRATASDERAAARGIAARIERLDVVIGRIQEDADSLANAENAAVELQHRGDARRSLLSAMESIERISRELHRLLSELADARAAALRATAEHEACRLRKPAADLAARLADGCPCPVCGSQLHPALATPPMGDELDSLLRERDRANRRRDDLQERHQRAEESKAVWERLVKESPGVARADAEVDDERWAELLASAMAYRSRARRAERWRKLLSTAKVNAQVALYGAESRATAAANSEASAEDQAKILQDEASEIRQSVSSRAMQVGLTAMDEIRRLSIGSAKMSRLDRLVATIKTRQKELDERVRQAEANGVPEDPGDPKGIPEACARAAEGERNASDLRDAALNRATELETRVPLLKSSMKIEDEARSDFDCMDTLVRAFEGKLRPGEMSIGLRDYAVHALLTSALEHASNFLTRMGGRYRLQAKQVRGYASATQIDLEVADGYTDRARPPESLSGGEGFQASLALALGLSEAVQEAAGGVRLDCLFIDEGFGSLDPTALEEAITLLTSLRSHDRMVGAISHVPAMQEQIESQLRVIKGRTGSSVEYFGC